MKPELLETLLLDRALGELRPEVAALLEAHLAQAPAAARRAAEFDAAVRLARAAVATPPEAPPRTLDVARLRRVHHAGQAALRRTEFLRLAACLALGLGLGWFIRSVLLTSEISPPPAAVVAAGPRTTERTTQFWSLARFAPASTTVQPRRKL